MSITIDLDDLMTNKEAATLLVIKPNTLEIWRHQGKGPPYLKLGDAAQSTVRYQRSAVVAWAANGMWRLTGCVGCFANVGWSQTGIHRTIGRSRQGRNEDRKP